MARDAKHMCHLRGLQTACEQPDDLSLTLGQPCWSLDSPSRLPGDIYHCGDGVNIQPSGASLLA